MSRWKVEFEIEAEHADPVLRRIRRSTGNYYHLPNAASKVRIEKMPEPFAEGFYKHNTTGAVYYLSNNPPPEGEDTGAFDDGWSAHLYAYSVGTKQGGPPEFTWEGRLSPEVVARYYVRVPDMV